MIERSEDDDSDGEMEFLTGRDNIVVDIVVNDEVLLLLFVLLSLLLLSLLLLFLYVLLCLLLLFVPQCLLLLLKFNEILHLTVSIRDQEKIRDNIPVL